MGFRINTNVIGIKAQRNLSSSTKALSRAMERLASGSRINNAGDDAAGLAVSEGLRSQIRGLQQAIRNANDGIGFLATAEGALAESTSIGQRIRELAIQSANGAISDNDRGNLNSEVQQLIAEFDRIATNTEFNGVFLLDGSFSTTDLQVGTRKGQTIQFTIGNARASALGSLATISGTRNQITTALSGLILNSKAINASQATDDTVSSAGNSYSAIAIAKNINLSLGQTGVTADVQPTLIQANNLNFGSYNGDLSFDGFKINGVSLTGTGINNVPAFIVAVNNYSNQTGVKARLQSNATSSIEFYAEDGRNIQMVWSADATTSGLYACFNDSANYSSGISAGLIFSASLASAASLGIVRTGAVKLRSSSAISITGSSNSAALGFATTSISVSTATALNGVSVATQAGSQDALAIVDAVLTQLVNIRAGLGATQNRLEISGSRLGIITENLSAAQSQIRDADIAIETAELTKQQILQQAGVAVLGQANVTAQAALSLLKF